MTYHEFTILHECSSSNFQYLYASFSIFVHVICTAIIPCCVFIMTAESSSSVFSPWMRWCSIIALLGIVAFMGGSIVRISLAFDLFVPGTLTWKSWYSPEVVAQTIRLFAQSGFYTLIGYGVALFFGVIVWLAQRSVWRQSGWLLMSGILCVLYIPVECIQARFDIDLIYLTIGGLGSFSVESAQALLLKRLTFLSGIPLLAMLGYCTALTLMVWQPLQRTRSEYTPTKFTPTESLQ